MAKITIRGQEYDLRVSLWATVQLEEKYGDFTAALRRVRTEKKVSIVADIFAILANAGRKHAKMPMDVRADDIMDCNFADLNAISIAIGQAIEEAQRAETVDGNEADDEEADAYAAELEAREKNG